MGTKSFLMLVVTCVAMAMFLVWQRSETRRMGYESGMLQRRAIQLEEENRRLLSEICILKAPQYLAEKVRAMELNLKEADVARPALSEAKPEDKNQAREAALASVRQRQNAVSTARSPRTH